MAGYVHVEQHEDVALVRVDRPPANALAPDLLAEVGRMNEELAERGRILVRPSGTEPVVRVLAEAQDLQEASRLCGTITDLVRRELG